MVLLPGRRRYVVLLGIGATAFAGLSLGAHTHTTQPAMLVQLRAGAARAARVELRAAGATLSVPALRVWRVPARNASSVVRELRRDHAVSFVEREHVYTVASAVDVPTDPLANEEWWRADVHADTLTPPGPGMPVTLVDTGVDFGHQEFVGRPNLIPLDEQQPQPIGGVHGTAVASVVGAPQNGIGLVGIYPQSIIRSYDASLGDGTQLPASEIANGIVAAAAAGRSVINLSIGGPQDDPVIDSAILRAVRGGSLVVAASGNSGTQGNWLTYPAADPHVFTVAATTAADQVADFSTESPYVDIAAPGVDIPVASALDNSYQNEDGTSFSSPMVAGAAAWLWTARPDLDASQVAEILRESARDVGTPGYDNATGYGILDVQAALTWPTPPDDTGEPNDTIGTATVATTRAKPAGTVAGRVETHEDPLDVLRIWLPAKRQVAVKAVSPDGLAVDLGGVNRSGKALTASLRNKAKTGHMAYVIVRPGRGVRDTTYSLTFSVKR
jgi:serine protease